jgi:hypothetical protein
MFQFAVFVAATVAQKRIVQTGSDRPGGTLKRLTIDVQRLIAIAATQTMLIGCCRKFREMTVVFQSVGVEIFP